MHAPPQKKPAPSERAKPAAARPARAPVPATNRTGLPHRLKAGVESLSGLAMDDVRVHYNSSRPARLQALAYAQGTEIHVGPGAEHHLPHEAWHVVQQMQGRVKSTLQTKGVAINDDCGLEREADEMGARALRENGGAGPGAIATPSPTAAPIQRKVGFEIEVPNVEVRRIAPRRGGSGEEARLLDAPAITKGATITRGDGWRLTPDGSGDDWYAEFITDAVEETLEPARIDAIMQNLTVFAQGIARMPGHGESRFDASGYSIVRLPGEIRGAFHVTGGVRLDRLIELLQVAREQAQQMVQRAQADSDSDSDDEAPAGVPGAVKVEMAEHSRQASKLESAILGRAAQGGGPGSSAQYQGLVALAGTYVAGQRAFGEINQPPSAKLFLPVLSRTSLSTIRKKVPDMPSLAVFVADVLVAAKVGADQAGQPLFPQGIGGRAAERRSIDANPDITIGAWLAGFHGGEDLIWSETRNSAGRVFGLEKVGPVQPQSLGCLPWFSTRAEGAIVELRNLPGVVFLASWARVGRTFTEVFARLNEPEAQRLLRQQEEGQGDANDRLA